MNGEVGDSYCHGATTGTSLASVALCHSSAPHRFAAEAPVYAKLLRDPVTNLTVLPLHQRSAGPVRRQRAEPVDAFQQGPTLVFAADPRTESDVDILVFPDRMPIEPGE